MPRPPSAETAEAVAGQAAAHAGLHDRQPHAELL
jgi:hypothetical protein